MLAMALAGVACSDFLAGPGLTEDPNNPIEATPQQQLVAFQSNMNMRLEGQLARNAAIYMQQVIGTNNQQLTYGTQYGITEADVNFMTPFYTGGGLVALRNVQQYGTDNGDPLLLGIAKVWEGFAFGMLTSAFGDVPYREANDPDIDTPALDPQQQVYADALTRIDEGIAALQSAPTAGTCDPADLIYCATSGPRATQISRWIAAAHTMKARFHLHLVERNGNAAYTAALAEAQQGIMEVPTSANQAMDGQAPGDFRTFHGSTLDVDGNSWAQFLTQRGGDIGAGNFMIQLLQNRTDPRLARYFTPNTAGAFVGVNQNNQIVGTGPAAQVNIPIRRQLTFRQPILTWAENQLIIAEAEFMLNGGAAALPYVNAVRSAVGMTPLGAITSRDQIMEEKYIVQFQNIDVWNDYKRTCYPVLARFGTAAEIPGRIPYQQAERNANPNIPAPSAFPTGTTAVSALRNWNDPAAC